MPARKEAPDLRERILATTADLLARRRFETVAVADILSAAGISRASFYFYFPSKQAVLAELVRRAVGRGHEAAQPWVDGDTDPVTALRAGITAGADLWLANAGVLTAVVEQWATDDGLRALWLEQMRTFTDATVARIRTDEAALRHLDGQDLHTIATLLTWAGERLYYLAAAGIPPFHDREALIDALTHLWTSTLYGTS
jgi:AcrR family transcriptional regulator